MNLFGLIRGLTGRRFVPPPPPWESRYTLFLKLVSRHQVGGLVFAHFVTNPHDRPDYVFQHDSRLRTFTQGDFETTRWTVKAITEEEDAMLERLPGNPPSESLVVLSDESGNIILQDYCTAEGAGRAMALVEHSTRRAS